MILGVSKSSSSKEIREAYRSLCKLYQRDHGQEDEYAEKMRKRLDEAYDVLGDSKKRRAYDRSLGEGWSLGETKQTECDKKTPKVTGIAVFVAICVVCLGIFFVWKNYKEQTVLSSGNQHSDYIESSHSPAGNQAVKSDIKSESKAPEEKKSDKKREYRVGDVVRDSAGNPVAVIFRGTTSLKPALGVGLKQGNNLQWAMCHYDFESGYDKTVTAEGYGKNIKELQGAFDFGLTDGYESYSILCNAVHDWNVPGNYPAFEYAESYTAGNYTDWYVPTIRELNELHQNLDAVNQGLLECGGQKIRTLEGALWYWSCTQTQQTAWAAERTDLVQSGDGVLGCYNQKGGSCQVLVVHRF